MQAPPRLQPRGGMTRICPHPGPPARPRWGGCPCHHCRSRCCLNGAASRCRAVLAAAAPGRLPRLKYPVKHEHSGTDKSDSKRSAACCISCPQTHLPGYQSNTGTAGLNTHWGQEKLQTRPSTFRLAKHAHRRVPGLQGQVRRRHSDTPGGHACAADLEPALCCRRQLPSQTAVRALCGSPGGAATARLSHSAGHA